MKLLNQLREDAARLADEAAPEVVAALEHLAPPHSLLAAFVALVGRLEQDVPGIVHPDAAPLPAPLTTHTPSDAEVEAAGAVAPQPFPGASPQQPQMVAPATVPEPAAQPQPATAREAQLEQRLAALESALTSQGQQAAAAGAQQGPPPVTQDVVTAAPGKPVQTG